MWYSDVCVRRGGWRLVWAGGGGGGMQGEGGREGMRWNAEHSGPLPPSPPRPLFSIPETLGATGRVSIFSVLI